MFCDAHINGQRHGLGLLIVRQIMLVHNGIVRFSSEPGRFLRTELVFDAFTDKQV